MSDFVCFTTHKGQYDLLPVSDYSSSAETVFVWDYLLWSVDKSSFHSGDFSRETYLLWPGLQVTTMWFPISMFYGCQPTSFSIESYRGNVKSLHGSAFRFYQFVHLLENMPDLRRARLLAGLVPAFFRSSSLWQWSAIFDRSLGDCFSGSRTLWLLPFGLTGVPGFFHRWRAGLS